ncbi:MAG TPA: heme NO-binding domain-containing protein [Flavobacterium sp.]|jgi:hypothetical protein
MRDLRVHGSIFFLLKKFVSNNFPENTWELLNERAGTSSIAFSVTENYSIDAMNEIVRMASEMTGIPENDLKQQFGEYLVNDLFLLYADYIRPEWRTFDIFLNTEPVMHGAVRRLNSTANPPVLNVTKVHNKLLIIDYHSRRKMAALAIGIIKGIAEYYGESESLTITPMSDFNDERVQIRLDFA